MMNSCSSTSARQNLYTKVCHQSQHALADSRKLVGRTAPARAGCRLRHRCTGCSAKARPGLQWRPGRGQAVKLHTLTAPEHLPTVRCGGQRRAVHQQPLLLAMGLLRVFGHVLLQCRRVPAGLRCVRGLDHYHDLRDIDDKFDN